MNILKQVQLNKSRSYTNCISAAVAMFFDNTKAIFRHVWAYALAYAILFSAYSVLYAKTMLYGETPMISIAVYAVAVLLLCANVAYGSRVMMMLNNQKMRWNIMRCIHITLVFIALLLVWVAVCWAIALCFSGEAAATKPDVVSYWLLGVAAFSVVFACLLLPLNYVLMKYLIETGSKLHKIIKKSYITGLRHWGFIFVTMLLTVLCVAVCGTLISMPTVIVLVANSVSVIGVQQFGDPTGLPSWFSFLQFGVTVLSAFIGMFINIFVVFVMYFMYGSVEERVKEKTEYLKTKE